MSMSDAMFSAGVGVPRRLVGAVGLFPATVVRKSRSMGRLVALVVIVVSIVGLWINAGLAQAGG